MTNTKGKVTNTSVPKCAACKKLLAYLVNHIHRCPCENLKKKKKSDQIRIAVNKPITKELFSVCVCFWFLLSGLSYHREKL